MAIGNNAVRACFKAYDIRGRVPEELDETLAYRIGRAFADEVGAHKVVVGHDVRLESPILKKALINGLTESGTDVVDIGLCGTEEVYFHTFNRKVDGGIMVTASHNPKGYDGMKLVKAESRPISSDTGLFTIRDKALAGVFPASTRIGATTVEPDKSAYVDHLLSYVDVANFKPMRIVVNPGNGGAGPVMRLLERRLPLEFVFINEEPDGSFPNGVPNPLLPEMRDATSKAVRDNHAQLGLAWDGDFDRCFFFDESGTFIEGYYLVGLLAKAQLAKAPNQAVIYDPRLTWNTVELVEQAGGRPVQSKAGHAFIKDAMRRENAIYGGEMSAHHYFRNFSYCDSGMIPWLLLVESLCVSGRPLSTLLSERIETFPCSGEINFEVSDAQAVMQRVLDHFAPLNPSIDRMDGIGLDFGDWRFNLRGSNTEPLVRLNVETRGDAAGVASRVQIIEGLITGA